MWSASVVVIAAAANSDGVAVKAAVVAVVVAAAAAAAVAVAVAVAVVTAAGLASAGFRWVCAGCKLQWWSVEEEEEQGNDLFSLRVMAASIILESGFVRMTE